MDKTPQASSIEPVDFPSETSFAEQIETLALHLNLSVSDVRKLAVDCLRMSLRDGRYALWAEAGGAVQQRPSDQYEWQGQKIDGDRALETSLVSINQGDIFWLQAPATEPQNLGYHRHPYVVVQDDLLNHSRIDTVVVCALTSNLSQASEAGNVLLDAQEADLPKRSVVVVSKISSVRKSLFHEYIGTVSRQRVSEILKGLRFQQRTYFSR